jgi:tRNA threonylcarbamoyl adenosine modification protein (Sua5/YciO/YrdC/YwlC family)
MAQYFSIHPENPQRRLVRHAADIVRGGGVIVYPTDSCYALGCHVGDKAAVERMRKIRGVDARHHFALVCRDLAEIGTYARIDNTQFRLLKAITPGSYTFILPATREVPKRLMHPSRRTIGIRLPDHKIVRALLAELGEPLVSSTLQLPGDELPMTEPEDMRRRLEHDVELILDGGPCGLVPTTVVNLTGEVPVITRVGKGSTVPLGEVAQGA